MAYPNLGEFQALTDREDWVSTVQWIEQPPTGQGNPWELEQRRYVWERERAVWPKIQALQREYANRERIMREDVSIFNSNLAELERLTKKKSGIGPIGTFGGMALAVVPGFGWLSAGLSIVTMGLEILGGNKKKKRIQSLARTIETTQRRLEENKQRLMVIQGEIQELLQVSSSAVQAMKAKRAQDVKAIEQAGRLKDFEQQQRGEQLDRAVALIRQQNPNRVRYSDEI